MAWDANWATSGGVGKLPLPSLTQLRAALAERASVVTGAPTLPAAPASGELPPVAWYTTYQSAVTSLITKYTDHTKHSGDYSGQTSIPAWSEANILTAIGASRITPASGTLRAAWAYQQYQILNLLRWVEGAGTLAGSTVWSAQFPSPAPPNPSWPNTITGFVATAWGATGGNPLYQATATAAPAYNIYAQGGTQTLTLAITAAVDLYFWSASSPFQPIGGCTNTGAYYRMRQLSTNTYHGTVEWITQAEMKGHSFLAPAANTTRACSQYGKTRVAKFGFTYKDW